MAVDHTRSRTMPCAAWQADVASAMADLDRLHGLIGDAGRSLLARFDQARAHAATLSPAPQREALEAELHAAVTALQFPDIAHQLIAHARAGLDALSQRLDAAAAGAPEPERDPAMRNGPVAQTAMGAGSIELF